MRVTVLGMVVFLHPTINSLSTVLIIALQLSRESYIVFPFSTMMDAILSELANGLSPILVTLFGMVIDASPSQLANAILPMLVTLLGMVIEVSFPQL